MSTKDNLYGLFSAKKLNPNLIAFGAIIVVVTAIFLYSGRHNKISVTKDFSIETNIPQANPDTSTKK